MDTLEVPLFPLHAVLFPYMPLPLQIFEPRYRKLVSWCVREGLPFGAVLIKEGREVGGTAVPHPVGTLAAISGLNQLSDGRVELSVVGTRRFRVDELSYERPYLSARVTVLPEATGDRALLPVVAAEFRRRFRRYVDLLAAVSMEGEAAEEVELPDDASRLSYVAGMLSLPSLERQALLASPTDLSRLSLAVKLLRREIRVLRWAKKQPRDDSPFNLN